MPAQELLMSHLVHAIQVLSLHHPFLLIQVGLIGLAYTKSLSYLGLDFGLEHLIERSHQRCNGVHHGYVIFLALIYELLNFYKHKVFIRCENKIVIFFIT